MRGENSEIESLRNESLQLKGLLVGEIEALESSLSAREEGETSELHGDVALTCCAFDRNQNCKSNCKGVR
jgi:hypothetical protein